MPIYRLDGRTPVLHPRHFVAPGAMLIGGVELGEDASVWFNAVLRSDSERICVGSRTNIQDGSVLHADPGKPLTLGGNVTVGHKVMLHGCTVGEGSLIGINSVVLNEARIGTGTIIGANSLIPEGREIPSGVLVLGSPGKVVRDLTPEEQAYLLTIADGYVRRAERYRKELKPF